MSETSKNKWLARLHHAAAGVDDGVIIAGAVGIGIMLAVVGAGAGAVAVGGAGAVTVGAVGAAVATAADDAAAVGALAVAFFGATVVAGTAGAAAGIAGVVTVVAGMAAVVGARFCKRATRQFFIGIDRAEQRKWNKGGAGLLVAYNIASGLVLGHFVNDRLEAYAVSRAGNPHVSSANQSGFNQAVSVSDLTQEGCVVEFKGNATSQVIDGKCHVQPQP